MTNKDVVSVATRIEVAKRLKVAYGRASKAEKGEILDRFMEVTRLSRSSARRYMTDPNLGVRNVFKMDRRHHKPTKYSLASRKALVRLWKIMGMPCGKYMAASVDEWICSLTAHGELPDSIPGWNEDIANEIRAMSSATIDRYLKEERDKLALRGISTTKGGSVLKSSIRIRTNNREIEQQVGFLECDTVAHCGPVAKGEFARTLTSTDIASGWSELVGLRNNAAKHMREGLDELERRFPFHIEGMDCDNGSEFINHTVIDWAASRGVFFTRSRPYQKNDQATVESKNNHLVRKYAFYYRYDTPEELAILNRLYKALCDRHNFFTPTRKPIGWEETRTGRPKRIYDNPKTPYQRLKEARCLSLAQYKELEERYRKLNPADLTREILTAQNLLIDRAKNKTLTLQQNLALKEEKRKQNQQGGIQLRAQKT